MRRSALVPKESRSRGSFVVVTLDAVAIVCAIAAFVWHPSAQWVETAFSNGYYPHWQHALSAIALPLPFSLGDVVVLAAAVLALRRAFAVRRNPRALLDVAAIAAVMVVWFYAGWGWGYDRAPLTNRAAYDAAKVNHAAIAALRTRAIGEMNRLAPVAHAQEANRPYDRTMLRDAWLPVVQRLGDVWEPNVGRPKFTLAEPFMDASGTSGFINPFTLESQLAPDLLWFETPFSLAHEWSHAAGYNREDEANYIGVVTCLRDPDAIAQYSGWLELFLYLPPLDHYSRSTFVPQVWADFAAIRERNAHFLNLRLSQLSWHVYNNYLKTNHVASGVENYNEVTQLVAGIPLDAAGLPERRP